MSSRNSTKKVKEPKVKKTKAPKEPKAQKSKGASFDASVRKAPPRKVPADVYTLVLLFGFIFFLGAVVMMYLDVASYK